MAASTMLLRYNFYSDPRGYGFQVLTANESAGSFTGKYQTPGAIPVGISGWFHFEDSRQVTRLSFTAGPNKFELEAPYKNGAPNYEEWHGNRVVSDGGDFPLSVKFVAREEAKHVIANTYNLKGLNT